MRSLARGSRSISVKCYAFLTATVSDAPYVVRAARIPAWKCAGCDDENFCVKREYHIYATQPCGKHEKRRAENTSTRLFIETAFAGRRTIYRRNSRRSRRKQGHDPSWR
jgi:hypothetical protein